MHSGNYHGGVRGRVGRRGSQDSSSNVNGSDAIQTIRLGTAKGYTTVCQFFKFFSCLVSGIILGIIIHATYANW